MTVNKIVDSRLISLIWQILIPNVLLTSNNPVAIRFTILINKFVPCGHFYVSKLWMELYLNNIFLHKLDFILINGHFNYFYLWQTPTDRLIEDITVNVISLPHCETLFPLQHNENLFVHHFHKVALENSILGPIRCVVSLLEKCNCEVFA